MRAISFLCDLAPDSYIASCIYFLHAAQALPHNVAANSIPSTMPDSKCKKQDAKIKKMQKIKERKAEKDKIAQKPKEKALPLNAQVQVLDLKAMHPRSSDHWKSYWHQEKKTGEWIKIQDYGYNRMGRYRGQKWWAGEKATCANEHCNTPDVPHNGSGLRETKIDGNAAWVCVACFLFLSDDMDLEL